MKGENIKDRTLKFAIRIVKMASALPGDYSPQVLAHQIVRSSSSAGANYRAASRSKSRKDFINKMKVVEEELDETGYWLELISDCNYFPADKIAPLISENNELLAIIVKSIQTARENAVRSNKRMTEIQIRK
jgi:four helix bundle protein